MKKYTALVDGIYARPKKSHPLDVVLNIIEVLIVVVVLGLLVVYIINN